MSIKVKILSFGRSKKDLYSDEIERLIKMCRSWGQVECKVLKPYDSGNMSVESALRKEAELLKKYWSSNSFVVSLGEEGKLMNSYKFADVLSEQSMAGKEIVFNIGSAYGLSDEVKRSSHLLLSLSKMTMPYKLCRLVFVEQVYRALAIINNHPYHKE